MTFDNPIETKSEAEGLDEGTGDVAADVAAALEGIRTDLSARLDKLETKSTGLEKRLSRPALIATPASAPEAIERKAFASYMRRGIERMPTDEVKTLTVSSGPAGGYLAPAAFGDEILKRITEYSPIRQYARVVKISAPSIIFPRRVASATAFWVSETGARTGSEPSFEQVTLTPYELATFVDTSTQALEDNIYGLEEELAIEFGEGFGKQEGVAFVNGTGTGQPKGLLTATGITEVKTGVAANFPASNPADVLIGMFHKVPTVVAQAGVWLMNRNTMATIRQWKDGQGRYLVIDPIAGSAASTLLGRPIVEAIDMPDIGANAYPIMFGDLSGYRIVDRVDLSILRDPFTLAAVGQVRIHARKRVGADVTHLDRFVKLKVSA